MSFPLINKQVALAAKNNRHRDQPPSFQEVYGATWFTINESNDIIGRLNKPVFDLDKEEAEIVFLMLFNCLSDIISAVYTLSSGWLRPSVTALRGALETIATATTINHDQQKMTRFIDGKLKIPDDVIAPSKQFLPSIGRLYGVLTNQWTHETFDSTARSINRANEQLTLIPEVNDENIKIYLNIFIESMTLAQMVGIALETCFPNLAGNEIHFSTGANGERSRTPAPSTNAMLIAVQARDSLP